MGYSNIIILCIVLQELHSVLNEVAIEWVTQTLCYIALFFKCYIVFLMRLPLNGLLKHYYLPPVFENGGEVLFWVPSLYPSSPPSPRMFCLISRLLLKLAF